MPEVYPRAMRRDTIVEMLCPAEMTPRLDPYPGVCVQACISPNTLIGALE